MNELAYNPNPSAIRIHDADTKVKAICGPVGSGKTSIACWEFFLLCYESKVPLRGAVIRESYRELQDSTRKTFFEWFNEVADYREKDEKALVTFPGADGVVRTHELLFRACRKESEATKFLSTEFAFIWLEEVCPVYSTKGVMGQGLPQGVFDVAKMRVRQKGAPRLEILLTFNPPTTRHWVYKEFFQRTPEELSRKNYALFRQPAKENEANLPQGYYDELTETLSPELARRFVQGEVVTMYDGVRVFPEAKDNWHIVEHVDPVPGIPLILGQDYGLTPCALVTQIVPGGQWRWLKEIQLWNRGMRAFVEHLVPTLKSEFFGYSVQTVWQDPAGNQRSSTDESSCTEILRAAGFNVQDSSNIWALRKESVKQRFEVAPGGEPGVLISRYGCPLATEGLLGGYRYPKSSDGLVGSMPIKNDFSHLMDCAQYIAVGEFSVMSGLAKIEETEKRKRITPVYNPLSSSRQARPTNLGWMGR